MPKPVSRIHGRYTIRAMPQSGAWRARAYLTGAAQGAGEVARAEAPTCDAVFSDLCRRLDEKDAAARAARRHEPAWDFLVPTAGEFAEALATASFSAPQILMLRAHAAAGDRGLTAQDLAREGGYADFSTANLHHGKSGTRIAERLGLPIPMSEKRKERAPTRVMAIWLPTPEDPASEGRWIMYPELRQAIGDLPL